MLLEIFLKCLNTKNYNKTPNGGDYAINRDKDTLYVIFQGSDGTEDWKNNIDFPARAHYRKNDGIWLCHRGFLRVWGSMRTVIQKRISEEISRHPEVNRIVCMGYSHGAALALLSTEEFSYIYEGKISVSGYGFGCPRVSFGIVPKKIEQRLKSFTVIENIPDIVTHLPPAAFLYHHVGNVVKIGEVGRFSAIEAHTQKAYIESLSAFEAKSRLT